MATVGHLFFIHFFTLILLVQARLVLQTTILPVSNNISYNKLVPKRYILREFNETTNNENVHKSKTKKVIRWVIGISVGSVAGIICGVIDSVLFKLVLNLIIGKNKDSGPVIFSPLIKAEDLAFLEKDDGVASLQIIGKGGCGEVYITELPESEIKTIAIKKVIQTTKDVAKFTQEERKKLRQVKAEIQTVGQIRHTNLLPLLAYVPRPNCHYLVYEFMKNGSLEDILQQVKDGTRELDWPARHRITLGVAAGLEYLHLIHNPRIVHRDLKPANVLLDDDMEARITDFGLAKAIPGAATYVETFYVAGTLGYMAPEYFETTELTERCDVYSFGVLLATLVMGKLPTDEFFRYTYEMGLVVWMRNMLTGDNPKQLIDPKLIGNGYEEQMLRVLEIACSCTLDNPNERPKSIHIPSIIYYSII